MDIQGELSLLLKERNAEIERLKALLQKYGSHEYLCDYTAKNDSFSPKLPCTCGWDEAAKVLKGLGAS